MKVVSGVAENQMAGTTKKPLADARENLTSAATVTVIPGPAKKLIAGTNRG